MNKQKESPEPQNSNIRRIFARRTGVGRPILPRVVIFAPFFLFFILSCEFKTDVRVKEQPLEIAPAQVSAGEQVRVSDEEARAAAEAERTEKLTNTARFFAGLAVDPSSEYYDLTQSDTWKCFARRSNALWDRFREPESRMKIWAQRELTPIFDQRAPVFYPFSGPDIIFPEIFLPCSGNYILVGLEPVGEVPQREGLSSQKLDEMLSLFGIAVQDIIRLSFYRTKVMEPEFSDPMLKGVLPILMVSLARLDMEVRAVETGNLDEDGEFVPEDGDPSSPRSVARIQYGKAGDPETRSLIYFSFDLSNGGLKKRPALAKYIERNSARCFTLIKSASYLCRKPYFSIIRKTILARSYAVLQDDSGLAFNSFSPDLWKVSLFGRYEGPVELFKDSFEQDLYDAMKVRAKPLNFRFGYSLSSCLTLAAKKSY